MGQLSSLEFNFELVIDFTSAKKIPREKCERNYNIYFYISYS